MKKILYAVLFTVWCCLPSTGEVHKQTFIYAVKGADTLRLDTYMALPNTAGPKPCILFVFGGSFMRGRRDLPEYVSFYEHFARQGYAVVAIDYRLGLKDVQQKINPRHHLLKRLNAFTEYFEQAVTMAVDDLFDATRYVVAHADRWNVDADRITTCGSSAGAITVLQGEYALCNRSAQAAALPDAFRYAGVIAFAGAIFSRGAMEWQTPPAPLLLFHGDADRNVPYNKLRFMRFGLYGSRQIALRLHALQSPCWLHTVENAAHEIASTPMQQHRAEIALFLDRFARDRTRTRLYSVETAIGKPPLKKKISLSDCLKANFNP